MLLFTDNVPRGVFCEQSSQKTRELSLRSKRCFLCLSQEGSSFCALRSVLLWTEWTVMRIYLPAQVLPWTKRRCRTIQPMRIMDYAVPLFFRKQRAKSGLVRDFGDCQTRGRSDLRSKSAKSEWLEDCGGCEAAEQSVDISCRWERIITW